MGARTAIAILLAGCAAPAQDHCVEKAPDDVIVVDGQAVTLPGRCKAWVFGPTQKQREEFDERKQQRGGA